MGSMASQITSLTIVYSAVYSGADQRKHQSSASLDFVRGNHRGPVNASHKWPVTRKMFPFDDVIMISEIWACIFFVRLLATDRLGFDRMIATVPSRWWKRISTHWGRDKMAAISQTIFSSACSWMKIYEFRLKFSLKFVLKVRINNIPALVQIMARRRSGDKPLSRPILVSLLTHIYASLGLNALIIDI